MKLRTSQTTAMPTRCRRGAETGYPEIFACASLLLALGFGSGCYQGIDESRTGETGLIDTVPWEICGDFECASLPVSLDYDDQSAGVVTLSLLRAQATDNLNRRGAVLYNRGAPGPGTIETAEEIIELFEDIAPNHDVVLVDNRGVGESTPINCADPDDLTGIRFLTDIETEAEVSEQASVFSTIVANCRMTHGDIFLRNVDSESVARDMNEVRIALGEERISYLGGAYGTIQGAMFAQLFPEAVDAFVLDAIAFPAADQVASALTTAQAFEIGLDRFFEVCGGDPSCTFHGGEGQAAVAAAYDALVMQLVDGTVEVDGDVQLPSALPRFALEMLPNADHDALAEALTAAEGGSWERIVERIEEAPVAMSSAEDAALFTASQARRLADQPCPDGFEVADMLAAKTQAEGAAPRMGALVMGLTVPMCLGWPDPLDQDGIEIEASDAPPMLLINGRYDPVTPLDSATQMRSTLSNGSHLLVWEGDGHTATDLSQCARDVMTDFFDDPDGNPSTLSCDD